MGLITTKHSMPAGDLLSLMPSLKHLYETTGKRISIYQRINLEYGDLYGCYPGAVYSIKNESGIPVTMNRATFDALKPLLLHQEYIHDFREWDGEQVDYDFDLLRQIDSTMPGGSINRWPFYLWPEMTCDLSKPWLELRSVDLHTKYPILINRTERYNNMLIGYNFLKKYEGEVCFIGLPNEWQRFCDQHSVNIPLYPATDFLSVAIAMKQCKVFIGNQSACFQIANGLGIPRVLEVCRQIPNVIGEGASFYDFINQKSLEYHVNKLYNS